MDPINRRTFGLGMAVGALAAAGASAGTAAADTRPPRIAFDETTLWDNEVDPLSSYHVHGLAVLRNDTILVATEGRHEVCDAGPRDLLLRRSTDGGDTWQATQTLVASVDGQSWGNPAFVVDRVTGGIFLFYMLSIRLPENTSCSGDIGDLYMISSKDNGVSWTGPQEMSGLFDHFPYDWALHGPGPGHGIQLDNGRLLLNCSHRRVIVGNTVEQRFYGVASIYSDNHGATWQTTAEVPVSVDYPINEARLVQLADGSVLVNGRAAAGGNRQRIVAVSKDRGLTWSPPLLDGSTGTFNAVDASLLRYTGGPRSSDVDRILFSRPDSPVRTNMTVSVSYDEAQSFRYSKVLNEGRSYYSELGRLSDGTILLLYGRDGNNASFPRRVVMARFSLDWLTDGRDSLRRGPGYRSQTVSLSGAREYTVDVRRSGSYELLLRYFRSADGGLATVTVDGRRPRTAVLDTTMDRAPGYDVAYLGTVGLRAGRHRIRFTASGPGRSGGVAVSLDTLRLISAPSEPDVRSEVLVDNDELGYETVAGTWSAGTSSPGYRGSNYRTAPAGAGERAVRWRLVVPRDGDYEVQTSHTAHENRASNAPFSVTHADGVSVVRVDQRVAGVTEPRGGSWVSLGTFRMSEGLTTIGLTNDADGYVVADAVRLLRR